MCARKKLLSLFSLIIITLNDINVCHAFSPHFMDYHPPSILRSRLLLNQLDNNNYQHPSDYHNKMIQYRACHDCFKQKNMKRNIIRLKSTAQNDNNYDDVIDLCVVGGGVSGLAAAITAKRNYQPSYDNEGNKKSMRIKLLEAKCTLGGRVKSVTTKDNYILDVGFAVFIEAYPQSKALFDYEKLGLKPFMPGALIYNGNGLIRFADPLRQPQYLLSTLLSPIGTIQDKFRLFPLFLKVKTSTVEQLYNTTTSYNNKNLSTLECLTQIYGFSNKIITQFFQPFLEGIFMCPLSEQSSFMFHFIMKMFLDGCATLPSGGMQAATDQLVEKLIDFGDVDILTNSTVTKLRQVAAKNINDDGKIWCLDLMNGKTIQTKKVIIATEETAAIQLLSSIVEIDGKSFISRYNNKTLLQPQPQRSIACVYYTFTTDPPIEEPILILNGSNNIDSKTTTPKLINSLCFPSVVNANYVPTQDVSSSFPGTNICSITIPTSKLMRYYTNILSSETQQSQLDMNIRRELIQLFPEQYENDVIMHWTFQGLFYIENAQPSSFGGISPANVHGGRDCDSFRETKLPTNLYICGDHMATASFNGAIESGIKAGKMAAER